MNLFVALRAKAGMQYGALIVFVLVCGPALAEVPEVTGVCTVCHAAGGYPVYPDTLGDDIKKLTNYRAKQPLKPTKQDVNDKLEKTVKTEA